VITVRSLSRSRDLSLTETLLFRKQEHVDLFRRSVVHVVRALQETRGPRRTDAASGSSLCAIYRHILGEIAWKPEERGETMTNPYKPPVDVAAPAPSADAYYVEATQAQRLANFALDYIGIIMLAILLGVVMLLTGKEDLFEGLGGNLLGVLTMAGYYLAFEASLGRTPAKFLTGTKVVDVRGGPARFTQILGRTFSRFVPFEPFSFLGSGHGWHDRWSDTRVVRTRGIPG
jgi:uncharacterized RDD family membrane protein YckC